VKDRTTTAAGRQESRRRWWGVFSKQMKGITRKKEEGLELKPKCSVGAAKWPPLAVARTRRRIAG